MGKGLYYNCDQQRMISQELMPTVCLPKHYMGTHQFNFQKMHQNRLAQHFDLGHTLLTAQTKDINFHTKGLGVDANN